VFGCHPKQAIVCFPRPQFKQGRHLVREIIDIRTAPQNLALPMLRVGGRLYPAGLENYNW
jgi:hypothetical protein